MFKKKRKGQLSALPSSAITMVSLVIIVAMGVLILVGMNSSTTNEDANEIIGEGITAMGTYGDWFTTIVIVIIGVAILGLVALFFAMRRGGLGRA